MSETLEASERAAEDWAVDNVTDNSFRCADCGNVSTSPVPSGPGPYALPLCEACAEKGDAQRRRDQRRAADWLGRDEHGNLL